MSIDPTIYQNLRKRQEYVRPRGMTGLKQRTYYSSAARSARAAPVTLTPEEKDCIGIQLRMITATGVLSKEQQKVQKELDHLCRGICHPQFNPLKVLFVEIVREVKQGEHIFKNHKLSSFSEKGKTEMSSEIRKLLDLLIFGFYRFNRYFDGGEDEFYELFKGDLENVSILCDSIICVGEADPKLLRELDSWTRHLKKKLNLLDKCLQDRKNFFPLLLKPLSEPPQGGIYIPSPRAFDFLSSLTELLLFGVETSINHFDEKIKKACQEIQQGRGNRRKKFQEQTKLKKMGLREPTQKLRKLLEELVRGQTINTLRQTFAIETLASTENGAENADKLLGAFRDKMKVIYAAYTSLRNALQENKKQLNESHQSIFGAMFDAYIADNLHLFSLMASGVLDVVGNEFQFIQQQVNSLEGLIEKEKSFQCRYITNGDLLFKKHFEALSQIDSQRSSPLAQAYLDSLIFSFGALSERLSHLPSELESTFSERSDYDPIFEAIENIRFGELSNLRKEVSSDQKTSEVLSRLNRDLQIIQSSLFTLGHRRSNVQQLIKMDVQIRFPKGSETFNLYPLAIFLMGKRPKEVDFDTLVSFFNEKILLTRVIAERKDLGRFRVILQSLQQLKVPQELKETHEIAIEFLSTNLAVLEKAVNDLKIAKKVQTEEELLQFARQLREYEQESVSSDEVKFFDTNFLSQLKRLFSETNLFEIHQIFFGGVSHKQFNENLLTEFLEVGAFVQAQVLFHHRSLMRWALEQELYGVTERKRKRKREKKHPSRSSPAAASSSIGGDTLIASPPESPAKEQVSIPVLLPPPSLSPEVFHVYACALEKKSLTGVAKVQRDASLGYLKNQFFPLVEEMLRGAVATTAPFLYKETLLLNSALIIEHLLKVGVAFRKGDQVEKVQGSHDLVMLANVVGLEVSKGEKKLLEEAEKLAPITSRHLWRRRGEFARLLRDSSDLSLEKVHEKHLELFKFGEKVLKHVAPDVVLKGAALEVTSQEEEGASSLDPRLEQLLLEVDERIEQAKATHLQKEVGLGGLEHALRRVRRQFLNDAPYYSRGIKEALSILRPGQSTYAVGNFCLTKVALLVEQTLLFRLALRNIEAEGGEHILFEKKGTRPLFHTHNLPALMEALKPHIELPEDFTIDPSIAGSSNQHAAAEPSFGEEVVADLKSFISWESRYLPSDSHTKVGRLMGDIRSSSHLLQKKASEFLTDGERKALRQEDQTEKLKRVLSEELLPKIEGLLKLTNALLDLA